MNKVIAMIVLAMFLAAGVALAQSKEHDMDMKAMPGEPAVHRAIGVVKSVDTQAGKVTVAHGPVKSLDWPAMTMTFAVRDQALLSKLGADKKVEVEFVQDGKDYVVTKVK